MYLPIAAFAALVVLFVLVLRRAGRFVARTRQLDNFRAAVRDLDQRIAHSLTGASERIDSVRRQTVAADTIGDTLAAASDAVARYSEEAGALKGPPEAMAIRDDIVHELGRAARALDMVEHGATILASVRRGTRELEAQTSIKRGYLNLVHAREAIGRHAARAAELEPEPGLGRRPVRPAVGAGTGKPAQDLRDEVSDHSI